MKIHYYDNWAKTPMIICLVLGCILTFSSLYTASKNPYRDTTYLAAYLIPGIILLALGVVFKIINTYLGNKY